MEIPKRCYELSMTIGADTKEDLLSHLAFVHITLYDAGDEYHSVSGGVSVNHIIDVVHNPDMDNKRYFKELRAYKADRDT